MLQIYLEILTIVLPVFLIVGLGYGLKRSPLVDGNFLFQLNRIIYFIALPLLLFYKIATADFSSSFNASLVIGVALAVCLGFCLSYAIGVFQNYPQHVRGTFSQCAFRGNLAYVGLAIVYNAYGESGLATAGILLGFIVPVLNFFSIIALLLPQQGSRVKPGLFVQQVMFNPLIVASFSGILWSFFQLPLPVIVDKALHIVTGMALPLALISIGASFSLKKLRGDLTIAFIATGFKLVAMPLLAAILLHLFGVSGQDMIVGVLFSGTPTATAAFIITQQMKGDAELAGSIIMLTTILSIVTFSLILMVVKSVGI